MKLRKAAALGLALVLCAGLCGCSSTILNILGRGDAVRHETEEAPPVTTAYDDYGKCLSFAYGFGDFNTGYRDYSVFTMGGEQYFRAEGSNGIDMNVLSPVGDEVLAGLNELIAEYKIYEWDGFYAGSEEVLDGDSFTLMVEYENTTLAAGGYAKKPDNYQAGHDALAEYLAKTAAGLPPKELGAKDEILEVTLFMKDEGVNLSFDYEAERAEYQHEVTRGYSYEDMDDGRLWQLKYDAVDAYNRGRDIEVANEEAIPFLRIKYRMGTVESYAELTGQAYVYGEDYEALRGQALALVGLPANFTEGADYQNEVYRGQFRSFQKIMFYDAQRPNYQEIVIDLPEQSLLIGGRAYTASAEAMTAFYDTCLELQADSFMEQGFFSDMNLRLDDYVESKSTDLDVRAFRELDKEDVTWLMGVSNGWRVQVFGGAEYAHDWEAMTAAVDGLIASARRVGYTYVPPEGTPAA